MHLSEMYQLLQNKVSTIQFPFSTFYLLTVPVARAEKHTALLTYPARTINAILDWSKSPTSWFSTARLRFQNLRFNQQGADIYVAAACSQFDTYCGRIIRYEHDIAALTPYTFKISQAIKTKKKKTTVSKTIFVAQVPMADILLRYLLWRPFALLKSIL